MKQVRRAAFIINPIAGGRDKRMLKDRIRAVLDPDTWDVQMWYTKFRGHAYELARTLAQRVDYLVAVGGDGTVHEVVNGMMGSGKTLAILPMGSGNGLARDLGIPFHLDRALKLLCEGTTTYIDVGEVNGRYFTNSFSMGLVADVALMYDTMGIRGFRGYLWSILKCVFRQRKIEVRIAEEGGAMRSMRLSVLNVMNISEFGYHLRIAPHASATDGHLHLQLFEEFPWYALPQWALRAFLGRPIRSKYLHSVDFRTSIYVEHDEEYAQCDGEVISLSSHSLRIRCLPASLEVVAPARGFQ